MNSNRLENRTWPSHKNSARFDVEAHQQAEKGEFGMTAPDEDATGDESTGADASATTSGEIVDDSTSSETTTRRVPTVGYSPNDPLFY